LIKRFTEHFTTNWLVIIPILLLLVVVTGPELDAVLAQTDESHSYRHVGIFDERNSVIEIIESVATTSEQHVPLYYMMLGGWVNVTGNSLFAMRMLSLLGGLLVIAVGYRLASEIVSRRIGLWFAVVFTTTAFFVHYNHEIRMYTFILLFTLCVYWFYWRVVSLKTVSWINWFGLYASTVALIYTHVFGIVALVAVGIYHVLTFSRRRTRWWSVVGVMILAGLTFVPWLPILIEGITTRKSISDNDLSFLELGQVILEIYTHDFYAFAILYVMGLVALLIPVQNQRAHRFGAILGIMPLVLLMALDEVTTLVVEDRMRYTLILLPSFVLLSSVGLDVIFRKFKLIFPIILIAWFVMGLNYGKTEQLLIYANKADPHYEAYPPIHQMMQYLDMTHDMPESETLFTITPTRNFKSGVVEYYSYMLDRPYLHIAGDLIKTGTNKYDVAKVPDRVDFESMDAFWLGYNVTVDPTPIWAYQNVLLTHHQSCGVHVSEGQMVLEYFVHNNLTCEAE